MELGMTPNILSSFLMQFMMMCGIVTFNQSSKNDREMI